MIQEAGCDVGTKKIIWVKVSPDFEILFRLMDGLRPDTGRRYWIEHIEPKEDNSDKEEDLGQVGLEVKISSTMAHNALTSVEEYVQ